MASDASEQDAPPAPLLQVVHGRPTADEVAALVAVLAAAGAGAAGGDAGSDPSPISVWGAHDRQVRGALHPRPGGWRASALPR